MRFEQYQNEDGKNIINISIGKDDNTIVQETSEKSTPEIVSSDAPTSPKVEEKINGTESLIIEELKKIEMNTSENRNKVIVKPVYYKDPTMMSGDAEEIKEEYTKREYYTLSGIVFSLILLVVLFILYQKGI